ncbi:MAG: hypothetical protein AB1Z57_04050 [Acidimicrobiia bacterium]
MKKFVFLAHGEMDQSAAAREAHMAWWSSIQDHVVDSGNPLTNATAVSRDGTLGEVAGEPALGYSIVQAESLEDAIALLELCPMDMWVYEAVPM